MTQSEDDIANRLLLSLPKASLNRLLPALELRTTAKGDVINRVDRPVEHYYFLNRGLISLVKLMEDGRSVEIGVIGIEGMTSPHTLFGFNRAAIEAIVQIPGSAFRIRSDLLRQLITEDDVLHETLYMRILPFQRWHKLRPAIVSIFSRNAVVVGCSLPMIALAMIRFV